MGNKDLFQDFDFQPEDRVEEDEYDDGYGNHEEPQEEVVETAHEDEQNSNNADDRDLDDMMADNDDTENCEPASQTTEDVIKDTPAKVCPEEKPAPVTPEKPAPAPKAPVKTKEPAWLRGVA